MIVSLTGYIEYLDSKSLILNVGGVGYELGITSYCYDYLKGHEEDEVHILTRYIVREDSQTLYGFYCLEERILFDKLCSISGVGPKLALIILSSYTPQELYQIVRLDDVASLTSISGVGKKMASRLMIELKAIFEATPSLMSNNEDTDVLDRSKVVDDVVDALVGMGFARDEVLKSFKEADDETLSDSKRALTFALKQLGGGYHVGSRS